MLVSHGAAAVLPDKDKFGIKFESTIPPSVLRVHLDVFLLHTVAVVFNKCLVVCVKVTPGKVLFFSLMRTDSRLPAFFFWDKDNQVVRCCRCLFD